VVGKEVDVGTWSGSVSDILSDTDSLKLEKIKDVWVNHPNWVLVGTGAEVRVEVNNESRVDEEGRLEIKVGKMMGVALLDS